MRISVAQVKEGSVTRTVFNEAVAEVVRLLENNDFDRWVVRSLRCVRRPWFGVWRSCHARLLSAGSRSL